MELLQAQNSWKLQVGRGLVSPVHCYQINLHLAQSLACAWNRRHVLSVMVAGPHTSKILLHGPSKQFVVSRLSSTWQSPSELVLIHRQWLLSPDGGVTWH